MSRNLTGRDIFTNWSFTIQSYNLYISKLFLLIYLSNKGVQLIRMTLIRIFRVVEFFNKASCFCDIKTTTTATTNLTHGSVV